MANLVNLWGESQADIIGDDSSPTLTISNISTGGGVQVRVAGAAPVLDAVVSSASGTVLKLNNIGRGYVSTNSAASMAFAMPINVGGVIYYTPVYTGVA